MLETSEYLKDWYGRTLIEDLTLLELEPMDRLYSTKYDFEHMTEKETKLFFRFSQEEIRLIAMLIRFPEGILRYNKIRRMENIEAWKVLLRRYACDNTDYILVRDFKMEVTSMSRLVNLCSQYLFIKFFKKTELNKKLFTPEMLQSFAESIQRKGHEKSRPKFNTSWVIGFLDGTVQDTLKPSKVDSGFFGRKGYSFKF
ncbi:unnamed protein product [Ambrosiozyma monospora]|uniref:Unnamed protein product n=1 Tax=Ambrosiozyma monospora TaxID=43982 RepID=A0ACB5UCS7_AMBMO|nr:unnamed protein product [Ambrosiozyma monospora]